MVASIPDLNLPLNSQWMQFWFVTVVPKYFNVSVTTYASSTLFRNLAIMYFSSTGQSTSARCLCCVYYRTECMPVVKFHADCSRCRSFSNAHWYDSLYFTLRFDTIATVYFSDRNNILWSLYMSSALWLVVCEVQVACKFLKY